MRIKKILSLAVVLAMVLTVVPMFGITASAAEQSLSLESSFTWNSTKSAKYSTAADEANTDFRNLDDALFSANWGDERYGYLLFAMPDDYNPETQIVTNAKMTLGYGRVHDQGTYTVYMVEPSDVKNQENLNQGDKRSGAVGKITLNGTVNTTVDFDATKAFTDDTFKSYIKQIDGKYYVAFALKATDQIGGFFGKSATNINGQDLSPKLVLDIAKIADVTIKFATTSGTELGEKVVKLPEGTSYTYENTVNDNYAIIETTETEGNYGYIAEVISSETKDVEASGTEVKVTVAPKYKLKSKNLFPDGEEGLSDWTVGSGTENDYSTKKISEGTTTIAKSTDRAHSGAYSLKTGGEWGNGHPLYAWYGTRSIAMYASANPNSMYYFAGAFYPGGTRGTQMTIATLATANDPTTLQGQDGENAELSTGGITSWNGTEVHKTNGTRENTDHDGGKFWANSNGKWNQLEYVLKTDANSKGIAVIMYYLNDCGTSYFDDFMLYEVEEVPDELTTLSRPEEITVIEGNDPLLPTTLAGYGKEGASMGQTAITWNKEGKSFTSEASPVTVDGYATDKRTVTTSVTVNVLPCADSSLASDTIGSTGKQKDDGSSAHTFKAFNGKVSFEFDAKFNTLSNSTITIGQKGVHDFKGEGKYPVYGASGDAISIQTNTGGLSVRTWSGTTPSDKITGVATAGNTYRFFITTDTQAQTYTVKITDTDGKVLANAEDVKYRNLDSKVLDTLVVVENGTDAGTDYVQVSNFRIAGTPITVPNAPTPSLGWDDETKNFTLNFKKDADKPGDAIEVNGTSSAWTEDTAVVKVGDKTNTVVTAYATAADGVVKSAAAAKSIYELVVDDIVTNHSSYKKDTVGADRIAAANKVISHGGFYYTEAGDDVADEVTKKIIKVSVDSDNLTAEIKADYKNFGLGFVLGADSTIYFGSADTEKEVIANSQEGTFDKLVITLADGKVTDQSKVTISAADGTVITLDSVNIEFVETLVEELEADGADADVDFIPEL